MRNMNGHAQTELLNTGAVMTSNHYYTVDQLSKQSSKLPQGSLSQYLGYAHSAIAPFDDVTYPRSQIDCNRKTNSGSGSRLFWTVCFHP